MSTCWKLIAFMSTVAISLLAVNPVSAQDLKVTFPSLQKQRTGKLILMVQVNPAAFPENGTATLEMNIKSGPPNLITGREIPYNRKGSTLQSQVDFARHERETLNFRISLRVRDKNGKEHTFGMIKDATIEPLPRESSESVSTPPPPSPESAFVPPSADPLSFNFFQLDKVHRAGASFELKLRMRGNRDGLVDVVVKDSFDNVEKYRRDYQVRKIDDVYKFEVNLTANTVLLVQDKATGTLLVQTPLPYEKQEDIVKWAAIVFAVGAAVLLIWREIRYRSPPVQGEITDVRSLAIEVSNLRTTVQGLPRHSDILASVEKVFGGKDRLGSLAALVQLFGSQERGNPDLRSNSLALSQLPERLANLEQLLGGRKNLVSLASWQIAPITKLSHGQHYRIATGMTAEEISLLAIVNRWWRDENPDRKALGELLKEIPLPIRFYAIKDIIRNLTTITETAYTFEPSENEGGWLWCDLPGTEEAVMVPADPAFFSVGNVMTLVQRMFDGFDIVPDNLQFACAYQACRLRRVHEQPDRYKVVSRGYLLLRGFPDPGLPRPPAYETMVPLKGPGMPVSDQLPKTETSDLSLPIILGSHLQKIATAFHDTQRDIRLLAASLENISQRLAATEHQPLVPSVDQGGRPSPLVETDKGVQSSQEMLRSLEEEFTLISERRGEVEKQPPFDSRQQEAEPFAVKSMGPFAGEFPSEEEAKEVYIEGAGENEALSAQIEGVRESGPAEVKEPVENVRQESPQSRSERFSHAVEMGQGPNEHTETLSGPGKRKSAEEETAGATVIAVRDSVAGRTTVDDSVEQLPAGWNKAVEDAFDRSGDQPDSGKADPDHYVKRIILIKETLRQFVETAGSRISVEIVHIRLEDERLQAHRIILVEEGEGGCVECKECGRLEGSLLFQLFPIVESEEGGMAWLLLPLGRISSSSFPLGYQILLEDVPGGLAQIVSVTSPARLRKHVDGHGAWYTTISKMQLRFRVEDHFSLPRDR